MGIADKKVAEVEKNQYNVKSVSGSRLQGTTRENKNVFDRLVEFLTGRFNDVIDDLISITEGNSGADNIGAAAMAEDGAKSVGGQLRELKILVDGKVDSDDSEIFSEDEKTKLLSVERNANYYVLPVASSAVMGGVKQGVGVEILADGTINGLSAPAPDLYAREEVLREAEKRAAADESLFNQVEAIASMAATVPVPTAATQIIISDLSNVSEPKYKTIGLAAAKAKPVSGFTVVADEGSVLNWQNPTDVIFNQQTVIRRGTDSHPVNITDGVEVYRGTAESYIDSDNVEQFYTAFGDNGIIPSDGVFANGNSEDYEQLVNYTMLYDQGDECTAVTGGWSSQIPSDTSYQGAASKTTNLISLYAAAHYDRAGVITKNMLSVSGCTGIYIVGDFKLRVDYPNTGLWITYTTSNKVESAYPFLSEPYVAFGRNGGINGKAVIKLDATLFNKKYLGIMLDGGSNGTCEANLYNCFAFKQDDWQTLCTKAGVTAPSTLEALIADAAKLTAIFANEGAISYMTSRCTGDFMTAVLNDINARVALKASPYLNKVIANIHWAKFMMMLAPELLNYTMLYDSGDECEDVTGGWNVYTAESNATAKKLSDRLDFTASRMSQSPGTQANAYCVNAVDLSNYPALAIFATEAYSSDKGVMTFGCFDALGLNRPTFIAYAASTALSRQFALNISSVTKPHKIAINVSISPHPGTADVFVRAVALLKADNWQIWMSKGGVTGFTELVTLLANSEAMTTLMASTPACKYLMGCTGDLMVSICNSQTAMSALVDNIAYDYAFDHPVWYKFMTMIPTSLAAMDSVAVKIPTMTSNVAPSGVASCTNYYQTHDAYKAFRTDGDMSAPSSAQMCFAISVVEGTWNVAYAFDNPVDVYKVRFGITPATQEVTNVSAKLQTSIDGETWQDVTNVKDSPLQANSFVSFVECLKKPILVKHIRVLCIRRASSSASRNGFGAVLQVYGKAVD